MSLSSWCLSKISEHDKVESTRLTNNEIINITHKNGNNFNVAAVSTEHMTLETIGTIDITNLDFLLNIKTDAYTDGNVYALAKSATFGIGGLGDVYRALNQGVMATYLDPEMKFIIRGLHQHRCVLKIERLDNRRFYIERNGLNSVTILALNDYDLTGESVRHGIEVFKKFDAILTSNPNCRRSNSSETAAYNTGVKILSWGQLMGQLNRNWS